MRLPPPAGERWRLKVWPSGIKSHRKSNSLINNLIHSPKNQTIMSFIKKSYEIEPKETLAMMIYGQSGMGKTTLACSAPSPVLFDFDGGISRVNTAHLVPVVQCNLYDWQGVFAALQEIDLLDEPCHTIVVDTASKLVDKIITHVCGNRLPQIKDWTAINAEFKRFMRTVQATGRNLVFVAQRDKEKEGDTVRFVPQFRDSNYKDVVCDLDLLGYMEMVTVAGNSVRRLTFAPTPRSEGKDCCGLGSIDIPTVVDENGVGMANDTLTRIINAYHADQKRKADELAKTAAAVAEAMEEWTERVNSCTDADSLNDVVAACGKAKFVADARLRVRRLITAKAMELQLTFDQATKKYVKQ